MSEIEDLRCFVEVAGAGGFTAAAQRLGQSKSILSRRIARLEDGLGARLLARTTRGVALTDAGAEFRERVEKILAEYDAAREVAACRSHGLIGRFRVTAPHGFGLRVVAPVLADMAAAHPQLEIDAAFSDRVADIVGERFDAAIRIGDLPDSTLVARRIGPVRALVAASPDYLARRGRPETPADLSGHECLGYAGAPDGSWRFRRGGKRFDVRATGRLRADSGEALVQWAVAGLGLAAVPEHLAEREIASGALVTVLEDYELPAFGVYVVRPPGPVASGKVRLLIDLLALKVRDCPRAQAAIRAEAAAAD